VSGVILDHHRIFAPLHAPVQPVGYPYQAFSISYADTYSLGFDSGGGYTDAAYQRQYVIDANGAIRIGFGITPMLGISVALQAPTAPAAPTTVSMDPTGIVNAATYAPFTAGISPGEFLVIYGSNFGALTTAAAPYPTTLNGLQVFFNATAAPIAYIDNTQMAVIVPSTITGPYVQVQVTTGAASNLVAWPFTALTFPTTRLPRNHKPRSRIECGHARE
jgi:hypothetical protein